MNLTLQMHRLIDRLPWAVARPIRSTFPAPVGYYFVVSTGPLIVFVPEDHYDDLNPWSLFFDALKGRRAHFLCIVRWAIEADPAAYKAQLRAVLSAHSRKYPEHTFVFLANNRAQQAIFGELGVPWADVNQNALADESLFDINRSENKKFDAIYNAVASPFKRHHLAMQVDNLALITYFARDSADYFAETAEQIPRAHWLNFPGSPPKREDYKPILRSEIGRYLNQARIGLCLSAQEGAMFASIEYMLCGLPVVSTRSIGGRDAFFDPDYVEVVDDTPEAVRQGVLRLLQRDISPEFVRARTLEKMAKHRDRLMALIERIFRDEGAAFDSQSARLFPNEIYQLRPFHKILGAI